MRAYAPNAYYVLPMPFFMTMLNVTQEVEKKISKCKEDKGTRLDLSKSELVTLSTHVKDLSQLTELFLYKNKLVRVPEELGCLTRLRTLAIHENHLTNLPDSLSSLQALEMLDLR